MIAIIKGDIVDSRKQSKPVHWVEPLKSVLNRWGNTPVDWELVWGDFFQLEVKDARDALETAMQIKACIKSIKPGTDSLTGPIDVRIAIGIGDKTFQGERISESNGTAFHHSGDAFDILRNEKRMLALLSPWESFNLEMNLYLKLMEVFVNHWSVSSAELVETVLLHSGLTQKEIGEKLGIQQSSVSGRWSRAHIDHMKEVDQMFRLKLQTHMS